jgi:sec-independent protein translocase protein TatA
MFGSFGWMELVLILFIVLIIFGAGKIPQLGEGLGKAIKGFKKALHEPEPIEATATPVAEPSTAHTLPPPTGQASAATPGQSVAPHPAQQPPKQA